MEAGNMYKNKREKERTIRKHQQKGERARKGNMQNEKRETESGKRKQKQEQGDETGKEIREKRTRTPA